MERQLHFEFKESERNDNNMTVNAQKENIAAQRTATAEKRNNEESTYAFGAAMLAVIALMFLG